MKNLILPAKYSKKKLEQAKLELLSKAKSKESKEIQLCGNVQSWDDCFTGFMKQSGKYYMIFSYNIGRFTYATGGEFDISG